MPGGGVDVDESLAECAARELREETGVCVSSDSMTPLCAWESFFPTSPEACVIDGRVSAQYLVVYFVCRANAAATTSVSLQADETDAYVWLAPAAVVSASSAGATVSATRATGELEAVPLDVICSVYTSERPSGCAEGHWFALTQLVARRA